MHYQWNAKWTSNEQLKLWKRNWIAIAKCIIAGKVLCVCSKHYGFALWSKVSNEKKMWINLCQWRDVTKTRQDWAFTIKAVTNKAGYRKLLHIGGGKSNSFSVNQFLQTVQFNEQLKTWFFFNRFFCHRNKKLQFYFFKPDLSLLCIMQLSHYALFFNSLTCIIKRFNIIVTLYKHTNYYIINKKANV